MTVLIKVVRIIPGSAAERQGGLGAEDTILTVSEKDSEPVEISDMRIREAVSYIRGPKGTEVILGVQKPDGSKKNIPIVRDVVQIEETYVKSASAYNGKEFQDRLSSDTEFLQGFQCGFQRKESP